MTIVAQVAPGGGRPFHELNVSVSTNPVPGGATFPQDYEALSVNVSIDPEDYSEVGGVWQARKTVALAIRDDSADEDDEELPVVLERASGSPSWARVREADGMTPCDSNRCLMTVTIEDNDSVPSAPQNLAATPGDGAVILAWAAPADPGTSAIAGYEYRYAEGASVPDDTAWTSAGTNLTATVGNLTNGTAHAFDVRAVSYAGASDPASTTATPEPQPAVTVRPELAAYLITEGTVGTGVAIIARTEAGGGRPNVAFSVSVTSHGVADGATPGSDYEPVDTVATFDPADFSPAGDVFEARRTVVLTLPDDSVAEGDETFTVRLARSVVQPAWLSFREADGTTACGANGCDVTVTISDNDSVPSAPQNLTATPADGEIALTWEAPADGGTSAISGYEYRHAEGASVPAGTAWQSAGTTLTVTVGSLTNGTEHAFEVRAVSDAGAGTAATATATPASVPGAPRSLAVTPADGAVTLRWQAPASDGGSAIIGYEYRYAEGASVPEETAWQSAGTNLTVTVGSLTNGTRYTFEVRVVNDAGEGNAAAVRIAPSATTTRPTAPRNLTATPGDGQITLTWNVPANDGGAAISGYEYRYAEGASIPGTTGWQFAGTSPSVTIGSLTNGTEYAFEVRASNGRGVSNAVAITATPAVQPTVPSAPQNLAPTPGNGAVTLTWEVPASNGGTAITGYEYRYAAGASVPEETAWSSAGTNLTVTVGSLADGTEHAFEVRAVNAAGEGAAAATTATPAAPATVPGIPQTLSAAPGDGAVTLTWTAPADPGSPAIDRYEYRYAAGASVPEAMAWASAGTDLTVTVGSLTNGTAYAFEVRAVNDAGEGAAARATARPVTVPGVPRNLAAARGDRAVTLTWNPPASNGGAAITGYEYRYAEGASVPAATVWKYAGTNLTVRAGGLTNGTEYAFEVRAVNAVGEGNAVAKSATPATVPGVPKHLSTVPADGGITLIWALPDTTGGSPIGGYEYRYGEGATVPAGTAWQDAGANLTETVGNLTNGTTYAFEVRAVNDVGESEAARVTAAPAAQATAPTVPRTLTATPGDGQVTLAWEPPASNGGVGPTGYEYRYAEGATVPSNTGWTSAGTARTVTVQSLTNGTAYTFEVRAVNGIGEGDAATATATPVTVPDAPQHFSTTPADGEITLTWQAPGNDGGSDVTGYEYRYAEGASVPTETAWTSAGTHLTATVGSLTNGTEYAFEVRAVSDAGEGDAATATATPVTVPDAPQHFSTTPADGEITLTWRAPGNDGGSDVTGYEYRHAEGASVPAETVWTSAGTNLTATVGSLTNGTEYAFEVRAVSDAGEGAAATVTATPSATVVRPSAPRNFTAAPGNGQVTLTWEVPASDGGAAITGYEYRYAEGASVPEETGWTSAGTSLTVTVGSLTNGTQYAFETRAANGAGEGDAAGAAATPATVPGAPQNLAATPGKWQVELTWEAPAGDGGAAITDYQFRYAEGASVPPQTVWTPAGNVLAITVGSLTTGAAYTFEVRAVNGIGEGAPATTTATTSDIPSAPRNLAATAGDGAVTLTWEVPESDGGGEIIRYDIGYREPGGTITEITGDNSLTATIEGLTNGRNYNFMVWAVNSAGRGTWAFLQARPAKAPGSPQSFAVTPADGEVTLTWQAPASDGGSAVTGYEYRHAEGASVPAETAWTSTGTALTVTVGSLTNGATYAFEVRAVNDAGESEPAAATATPATVPGAPQSFAVTPGDGEVTLTWVAPANDGGFAVTGYEYRYAEGASVPAEMAWTPVGDTLGVTVTGLADGTEHIFQVRAVSEAGQGNPAQAGTTVLALPLLSVADVRAEERTDAAVGFTVALSRSSTRAVSVNYATADGTATAGEDYERTAGTLEFAAGETEKTVSVPLLRDARDEGEETFVLALSNARNARIANAHATATIANDQDPLPGAWLVRFGRTVAQQVVDAVGARFGGTPRPHATIGGVPVPIETPPAVGTAAPVAAVEPHRLQGERRPVGQPAALGLPLGSSFHVSSEERGEGTAFSAWGRVVSGGFDARAGNVRMDGQVTTGILAVDTDQGPMTLGAAITQSRGQGSFAYSGPRPSSRARGKVRSTLTGIYPYARLRVGDTLSLWGLAGTGRGRLTLMEEGGAPVGTDTALTLGALGMRKTLLPPPETGGVALSFESDAFWVRTSSEPVRSATVGNLEASKGDASRLRLERLGKRSFSLGNGQTLVPSLSVRTRWDGGDAETGFGLEAGGGIVWSDAARGVSSELNVRRLLTHEAQGFRDWGMSSSVRLDPSPSSRKGLALSLSTSAGSPPAQGAEPLLGPGPAGSLADRGARTADPRVAGEIAYGTALAGGRLVGSPFVGAGVSGDGRDISLGWRLDRARSARRLLAFSVAATHSDRRGGGRPELGVAVSLTMRW